MPETNENIKPKKENIKQPKPANIVVRSKKPTRPDSPEAQSEPEMMDVQDLRANVPTNTIQGEEPKPSETIQSTNAPKLQNDDVPASPPPPTEIEAELTEDEEPASLFSNIDFTNTFNITMPTVDRPQDLNTQIEALEMWDRSKRKRPEAEITSDDDDEDGILQPTQRKPKRNEVSDEKVFKSADEKEEEKAKLETDADVDEKEEEKPKIKVKEKEKEEVKEKEKEEADTSDILYSDDIDEDEIDEEEERKKVKNLNDEEIKAINERYEKAVKKANKQYEWEIKDYDRRYPDHTAKGKSISTTKHNTARKNAIRDAREKRDKSMALLEERMKDVVKEVKLHLNNE
jgi:hypothetical protein